MTESRIFINFSNHPSSRWTQSQLHASAVYGKIIDVPFPEVSPQLDEEHVRQMADRYAEMIASYEPSAVMCQGEFTLCYAVVQKLKEKGIRVLAACSERRSVTVNGVKSSIFQFVRYREY